MAFRLLVYIVRAIELHRKKNPNVSLPLIYPLVVYSGVKPWNAPRDIYGLFGEEENIAKEVMFKPYQLIDLARLDEHEIKQHAWSGLAEFALKYRSAVRNVEAFCDVLFPWLKIIEQQDGESYCKIVLNYVINVLDIDDEKIFVQKVQEHLTGNLRGEAMTLAERFEQKGLQKGLHEGLHEGLQKGLQKGLHEGLHEGLQKAAIVFKRFSDGVSIQKISSETGLTITEIEALIKPLKAERLHSIP